MQNQKWWNDVAPMCIRFGVKCHFIITAKVIPTKSCLHFFFLGETRVYNWISILIEKLNINCHFHFRRRRNVVLYCVCGFIFRSTLSRFETFRKCQTRPNCELWIAASSRFEGCQSKIYDRKFIICRYLCHIIFFGCDDGDKIVYGSVVLPTSPSSMLRYLWLSHFDVCRPNFRLFFPSSSVYCFDNLNANCANINYQFYFLSIFGAVVFVIVNRFATTVVVGGIVRLLKIE